MDASARRRLAMALAKSGRWKNRVSAMTKMAGGRRKSEMAEKSSKPKNGPLLFFVRLEEQNNDGLRDQRGHVLRGRQVGVVGRQEEIFV